MLYRIKWEISADDGQSDATRLQVLSVCSRCCRFASPELGGGQAGVGVEWSRRGTLPLVQGSAQHASVIVRP